MRDFTVETNLRGFFGVGTVDGVVVVLGGGGGGGWCGIVRRGVYRRGGIIGGGGDVDVCIVVVVVGGDILGEGVVIWEGARGGVGWHCVCRCVVEVVSSTVKRDLKRRVRKWEVYRDVSRSRKRNC